MTASPSNRSPGERSPSGVLRLGAALLVFCGALWPEAAVWAQSTTQPQAVGKPIQLAPPSLFAPIGEPATGATGGAGGGDKQGIEVNQLETIKAEAIGILEPDDGGLGAAMWRGTDRSTVEELLLRLPADYRSATLRDLARRLLLSNAATPGGEGDNSLLALRIERLVALGDAEGVAELTRVVPQRLIQQPVARARVDSLFLTGDLDTACRDVRNGASAYAGEVYWAKALVFCQIVEGRADEAALGLALLREQVGDGDPAYFALVEAISGVDVDLPQAAASTPLRAAMLRFSGKKAPAGLLDGLSGGLLAAVAMMPNLSLTDRAMAAERAVAGGAMEAEGLREVYSAFAFAAEEMGTVLEVAPALDGPLGRALLYQAARAESLPVTRAEILNVALDSALESGHYPDQVQVLAPLLAEVPPQPQLLWFAETAGRAFFVTRRYEQAGSWFALARSQIGVEPAATEAVARLWPYAGMAGFRAAGKSESLTAWRTFWVSATAGAASDQDGAEEQLLLRASFQALGTPEPASWVELAKDGDLSFEAPLADIPLLYAIQDAAAAGRAGEAVLTALVTLGSKAPGEMHPVALGGVLGAFRALGLEDEARSLAVENALARGV